MGFNNEGHAAALKRLEARQGTRRHRRRQHRRQQGFGRPDRRLCEGHRGLLACGVLFHRQHLVAQHAGLARAAVPGGAGAASGAAQRGARGARRRGRPCCSRSRPTCATTSWRISPLPARAARSMASSCPTPRSSRDGLALAAGRRSRAGFRAGRCLRCRRGSWRGFICSPEGAIPLVGAGGVHDAASALLKIRAGASLVQLYSALVYQGPGLVGEILAGIAAELGRSGETLASLRGRDAAAIAHQGLSGT